jgi:hypothetical protein
MTSPTTPEGLNMAKPKITKLTPEQEAELPRFRQRYLDLACNGGRIDRETLQTALNDAYAVIGKPSPKLFIFDSPASCMMALKIFKMPEDAVLRDQLRGQLGGQLRDQLGGQLGGQLRGHLWDQQIYDPHYLWGSQDLYWIAWARFAQHIGVKLEPETDHRIDIMERIATQCDWWWPYEGIVVASARPLYVRWDDQRRLHCEDGAAIAYADGYSLFAWHGTRLPERWVLERTTIDPSEILKEQNVEMRAAGLQCIGMKRVKDKLGKKVHDSGDPSMGALWDINIPGLPRPGRYLSAHCPRNGEIFEAVPMISDVDGLPIDTALAAQAWRIGDPQSDYQHPPTRT